MNLIAAADENWAIGMNQKLLVRIPEDMKRFRRMTVGKVVVLGRKTMETFPGGQPLKDRTNIVLSKDQNYRAEGALVVRSLEELAEELSKYRSEDIFVIGGESIYRQLLDKCDTAYITKIDYAYQADAWLPDLDEEEGWQMTGEGEEQTYFDLEYRFLTYSRR
ncbi:MAG: dihydrofolate reductase [Lachnospiraceae bacterium]|nr:dihydrofolate reductase [Lachnospiraceae bacterium]